MKYKKISIAGVEGSYSGNSINFMSAKEKLKFRGIAFYVSIDNLTVSNYNLGTISSYISCDTTGDILIGMNILKYFDIHIGISKENNKVVFLGCLKNKISNEYLSELEKHFGYIPSERCIARIFRRDLF